MNNNKELGTLVANARLVPTRVAANIGTDVAYAKPMPTSGAVTCEYLRRHKCVNQSRTPRLARFLLVSNLARCLLVAQILLTPELAQILLKSILAQLMSIHLW